MKSKIVNEPTDAESLYEESTRLIKAANEEEAREKAVCLGKEAQHSYANDSGEMVAWEFVEILEVQELCEENFYDGIEVFSRMFTSSKYNKNRS